MIIKTRSKSFINQVFKDVAADRCCFKLRWKCHIITITIYAVHGSTAMFILREDPKIVALFEKGELAPCLQLVGEKPGEEFCWYILWKGALHLQLIGWKGIKEPPDRASGRAWKMIVIPQGKESLPKAVSSWGGQQATEPGNTGVYVLFWGFWHVGLGGFSGLNDLLI